MSDRHERVSEVAAAAKQRVSSKLGHIWWVILLRGLLALGLAICALVWPQKTLEVFVKLLGIYLLIDGVIGVVSVVRSGEKTTPLMQAVVSLVMGLVLLLWPGISERIFLILAGVWLALQGASLLSAAFQMEADDEVRGLALAIGAVMALLGAAFVFWPNTGVVTISWLIAIAALVIGGLLVYLATRVRRIRHRIDSIGSK